MPAEIAGDDVILSEHIVRIINNIVANLNSIEGDNTLKAGAVSDALCVERGEESSALAEVFLDFGDFADLKYISRAGDDEQLAIRWNIGRAAEDQLFNFDVFLAQEICEFGVTHDFLLARGVVLTVALEDIGF